MTLRPSCLAFGSVLVALVVAACEPGLRPTASDLVPERVHGPRSLREEFAREGAYLVSPRLEAPEGASRVAFLVELVPGREDAVLSMEARGIDARGRPGPFLPAFFAWSEGVLRVARVDLGMAAFAVEVRFIAADLDAIAWLTYSAVVPFAEGRDGGETTKSAPVVDIEVPGSARRALLSGVRPRADWGARAASCTSLNETKTKVSVHHTASPSTPSPDYAARIRGIQSYHIDGRGWCDIGYHYVVTIDGTRWEGREARFLGAHVGGHNTNNLGVSMVGCFHPTSDCDSFPPVVPPNELIQSVGELVGTAASHYGILVSPSTVLGHRDNPDQSTSCPGNNGHARLDDIRAIAAGIAGAGASGRVQGVVWDLSLAATAAESADAGARLPGARIECDCGTTATARAGDAYWFLDLPAGSYTLTARLDGYAPSSRPVQVTAGANMWASIGISPAGRAVDLTVIVRDVETSRPVPNALVEVSGAEPIATAANGEARFSLEPGELRIAVAAEGYEPAEAVREVQPGEVLRLDIGLAPLLIDPGEIDNPDDVEDPRRPERVRLKPTRADIEACRCVLGGDSDSSDPTAAGVLLLGLFALAGRRRRRA